MAAHRGFNKMEIVREELRNSPTADSRTIARKLCNEHPKLWSSIEAARSAVRVGRGANGEKKRREQPNIIPRIQIPKADHAGWKEHYLPSEATRWLVISDVHFPYHSPRALQTCLDFGKEQACDGVLINGDFVDFCPISVFEKDPRIRDFEGEVDIAKRGLDVIQSIIQPKLTIWKGGNHEARFARYLMQRAPEMFAEIDKHFNMESVFGLKERGIQWIPDRHFIRHKELHVIHGHELGNRFASPVNPARGLWLRTHACAFMGHEHKTSDHTETTLDRVAISCWSTGCLCNLRPAYRPVNSWNHGFLILDTSGSWSIKNYRIIGETRVT